MLVFKQNDIELSLGESVVLQNPKESPFGSSTLLELFEKCAVDEVRLMAKQREWLEVYFELTLYKNGTQLTENDYFQFTDGETDPSYDNVLFTENGNFQFLRYIIRKGAIKL